MGWLLLGGNLIPRPSLGCCVGGGCGLEGGVGRFLDITYEIAKDSSEDGKRL